MNSKSFPKTFTNYLFYPRLLFFHYIIFGLGFLSLVWMCGTLVFLVKNDELTRKAEFIVIPVLLLVALLFADNTFKRTWKAYESLESPSESENYHLINDNFCLFQIFLRRIILCMVLVVIEGICFGWLILSSFRIHGEYFLFYAIAASGSVFPSTIAISYLFITGSMLRDVKKINNAPEVLKSKQEDFSQYLIVMKNPMVVSMVNYCQRLGFNIMLYTLGIAMFFGGVALREIHRFQDETMGDGKPFLTNAILALIATLVCSFSLAAEQKRTNLSLYQADFKCSYTYNEKGGVVISPPCIPLMFLMIYFILRFNGVMN